jgi:hypothetical protein
MDFKIKIDLSNQSIITETPKKEKGDKKKKKDKSTRTDIVERSEKSKKKVPETSEKIAVDISRKKKKYTKKSDKKQKEIEPEKPKINLNSVISMTLPVNENQKGDQAQKLSMITKKKPRHWERRWVLVPNVFEFTKEIWLKKWVLVDGGDDIVDSNVSFHILIN